MDSIPVLFEDDHMIVVNKPAGLAVHGGTGLDYGLIEAFRELSVNTPFLELVHRLDRETSGCLMLAKSRKTLLGLQELMSGKRGMQKRYQALVAGNWNARNKKVAFALRRKNEAGEDKRMVVDQAGQNSLSIVNTIREFKNFTLLEVDLKTGRMHQARVHCASSAHPIAGDRIYGDRDLNRKLQRIGLGRMFLHASNLNLKHPVTGHFLDIDCPLPGQLLSVLEQLDTKIS
jgi:23S rRNA pseudouridine955/2504/2580 synthase